MFGKMRGERKSSTPHRISQHWIFFVCRVSWPRCRRCRPDAQFLKLRLALKCHFGKKEEEFLVFVSNAFSIHMGLSCYTKELHTRKWRILMITWKTPMLKRRVSHQNEVIHDCWMVSLLHSNNTSLFPTTASLPPFYNEVIFCWELMKRFDDHVSVLTRTFDGFNLILYFELWIDCTITTICSTSPSIQWLLW